MEETKTQEKLSWKDFKKVFWRMQTMQFSWNYERMQNLGYLYTIKPILKKIYANSPKEEKVKAMKRHLEFFNTNPIVSGPIIGVTAAMEEQGKNDLGQAVSSTKVGLMGPLAGLGDSIFWLTWRPICMSIGASFAAQGNALGIFLALVMFNILSIPMKYYGIKYGYEKGVSFIQEAKDNEIIQRYTTMATILGLVLVGGLIPQMVTLKVPFVAVVGQVKVEIQKVLDAIMPSLLPLIATFICYRYLKKGKSVVILLLLIIVLSIALKGLGVL
jgi:Phosphotransferase system, mannose/fructose/N-acetylgalactosamine-specific component IID